LELGQLTLTQRRRGGQRLQSLDLADDLTVDTCRQSRCLTDQVLPDLVLPDLVELRVGDANSNAKAEQQERRNDRASEHELELPQWSRPTERWHRSEPQDDPTGDAEHANGCRQRGCFDWRRAVERIDADQVGEQRERGHGAGEAAEHGRSEVMPFEAAEYERPA